MMKGERAICTQCGYPKDTGQHAPDCLSKEVDLPVLDGAEISLQDRRSDIANVIESTRTGRVDIKVGDLIGTNTRKLGSGGSKNVFDVELGGQHFAIALPNHVDGADRVVQKWTQVLNESSNTKTLRDKGFFTNDLCEVLDATVNDTAFPALIMHRYADLPFEVRDSKNPSSSTGETRLIPEGTTGEQVMESLETFASDLAQLIKQGVEVGRDSVNICVIDGQARLFLNDLGSMRIEEIPEDGVPTVVRHYAAAGLAAFLNAITEAEYDAYKDVLDDIKSIRATFASMIEGHL